MVTWSGLDHVAAELELFWRRMLSEDVLLHELGTALIIEAARCVVADKGSENAAICFRGMASEIEQGAFQDDYVAPEARMLDEEEARERRQSLTVIEGGGGSKV